MRADATRRDVLAALVERYPYGHTAADLRESCGLHTGQEIGGILRSLRSAGLVERSVTLRTPIWWATEPAVQASRLLGAAA